MAYAFRFLGLALALALVSATDAASAAPDPELAKGIQQIDNGDYDDAIMTLDAVTRRLVAEPGRHQELSEAYLYLGIAFLGKGHEAAAKAKFRAAVRYVRELSLSPEKFSPRVIGLLETARAEEQTAEGRQEREAAQTKSAPSPAASPAAAPKARGSRAPLILGGLGVAAAGGAALALKGGGSKSDGTTTPVNPACNPVQETRTGILTQPNDNGTEIIGPAASEGGPWTAEVAWRGTAPLPNVDLFANVNATGETLATGQLTAQTNTTASRVARWNGTAGVIHRIAIFLEERATTAVDYTLTVSGPCR